jgi:uncharacterized protein YneF (UPF0154 family)
MAIYFLSLVLVLIFCAVAGYFILRSGDAYEKTEREIHDNHK